MPETETHHDFVENTSSSVRHFVKLIDTANTSVREDESTTVNERNRESASGPHDVAQNVQSSPLENELFRIGISSNVGGQSDCRRSLSRGVHSTRCDLVNVLTASGRKLVRVEKDPRGNQTYLQNLRFTRTRISDEQNVDITSIPRSTSSSSLCQTLVRSSEQL